MTSMSTAPIHGWAFVSWRLSPAQVAFIGSLFLSLIAIIDSPSVNRDGMLYVDLAQTIITDGFQAARQRFDWLFLPLLIAGVSKLTGLSVETSGYLLCSLLMAGACSLLVQCSVRLFPTVGWTACLVALGLPAFNEYRDHIIREFGAWFFSLLAIWLAIRWSRLPRWSSALGIPLSLAIASAFRVEALALYPAILLWQVYRVSGPAFGRRFALFGIVPACVLLLIGLAYVSGLVDFQGRIWTYLNPAEKMARFNDGVSRMADAVLNKYSQDSAAYILFFGLLAMIPVKFVQMLGVFAVPLGYTFARTPAREWFFRWQPFGWVFISYVAILVAFIVDRFFVTERYVSFLHLLAVPLIAVGLSHLLERVGRGRPVVLVIAVVAMLANVISVSPKKMQYVEAGAWLKSHPVEQSRAYIESRRVSYHAGLGYPFVTVDRNSAVQGAKDGRYDMLVLEGVPASDSEMAAWLEANGLELLARFDGPGSDILVLAPDRSEK